MSMKMSKCLSGFEASVYHEQCDKRTFSHQTLFREQSYIFF